MAGYIHDPLQIINLIADNLRDRYKSGFPVLKEIIQNADDAGADGGGSGTGGGGDDFEGGNNNENITLDFGLSSGIPTAQHPLLQGPALYFINNGNFKDSDDRAIRSFGLNRKAAEQSSIGKFGLGMKSVFHFCEAFFFLAQNQEKKYAELLNPWSGNEEFVSHHTDWDRDWELSSSTDGELIKEQVLPVLDTMDLARGTFFLLWLPLRKEKHLQTKDGKTVGSIINEFPGDNPALLAFLNKSDLAQRIASLIPLLRRITQIRFWDGSTTPVFDVMLDRRSTRISCDLEQAGTGREMLGVVIYTRREQEKKSFTSYTGQEMLVATPELLALKQSPLWPKTFVRNEFGESEEAPDKAKGHCAAVFTSSDEKGIGHFIINWAVFLPIGEKRNETKRCGGDRTFRLTLHGYFFVDAGRADIEGLQEEGALVDNTAYPSNEAELRSLWNSRLARQGTLPLILPSLAGFVTKTKLSADDRWNLSQGLSESQTFKQYRRMICAQHSWVCRLTRKGKEWGLMSLGQAMRSLPQPPASVPDRPWATFPQLEWFENQNVTLLLKVAPHLHASTLLPQWNEAELLNLLQLDEKHVFSDQGCLDYLLAFLTDDSVRPFLSRGDLQGCLLKIFKRAFGSLGTELRQHHSRVQEFVAFIQPEKRYPIKQDVPAVIQQLQNSVSSVLILANEFDSSETVGKAQFSIDDAFVLLQKLHSLIVHYDQIDEDKTGDFCREIAWEILQKQPEEQQRILLAQASHLKILSGYDCTRGKISALSFAEIQACHRQNLLFRYSGNLSQQWGLAPKLQTTIKESVIVANRVVIELVCGKNNQIPACNAEGVLDALGKSTLSLQSMTERRQLLQDTAGADLNSSSRVRGLRYLLHGLAEHFEETDTLWVSGYEESAVWGKIWKYLQRDVPNHWTLIDRKLVEEIAPNKWSSLKIQEVKPKGILEEISRVGTEKLIGIDLNREDRNTVLRELSNDEELWRLLPFHETVQGRLVRIVPGKTYLGGAIHLPDELVGNIDLIIPSADKLIQRSQSEWIESLRPDNIIQIVLRHGEPSKFWSMVLDHLDNALQRHDRVEFIEDLAETAWLLDNNYTPVKPADVIHLEGLQDEVNRMLVHARGAFSAPENLHPDIQAHPNFKILTQYCFATKQQGFEKLALLLGETSDYRLGALALPDDPAVFLEIVKTCIRFPASLRFPGWGLLDKALEVFPTGLSRDWLFQELFKPISPGKIITILHWLKEEHDQVGRDSKKNVLLTFNRYLAAFVAEGGATQQLSELVLLNCEGNWKPAKELCVEAEGVAGNHLLDDEHWHILKDIIVHADRQQAMPEVLHPQKRDLRLETAASAGILEEYFMEWKEVVSDEIICAFLSLLGCDQNMVILARKYSGKHSYDWIIENIKWEEGIANDKKHEKNNTWKTNLKNNRSNFYFLINICNSKSIEINSIIGSKIIVPIKELVSSLIVGNISKLMHKNSVTTVSVNIRKTDTYNMSPKNLSEILRKTSELILRKVYGAIDCDMIPLWEELDRSELLDIRTAQQLVLNNIPFYLKMLKVQRHPLLQSLINKWDEARYRWEEYHDSPKNRAGYEKEQRDTVGEIQNLLRNDEEVQGVVLNAVRAKMLDYQYTLASIPFELFQNADDAVVELLAMQVYPDIPDINAEDVLSGDAKRFVVHQQDNALTFFHWGRRVNEVGSAGFPGREKGFHRDLEKMLVLSSSDKSEESNSTLSH